jgi:hypothetical protein
MDNCFGFNLGSKPAPPISVRSLSVGSVASVTAVDFSRAFISGCVLELFAASFACKLPNPQVFEGIGSIFKCSSSRI